MTWELNFSGSTINNKLVDIGVDAQGQKIKPIIFGWDELPQRHQEGYALGSYFTSPIKSFADANGDGRPEIYYAEQEQSGNDREG